MTLRLRKTEVLIITIIIVASIFIRFYNFKDRINFGPEQAISLQTSAEYLSNKFSLLGQPDLIRNTSTGFVVYQGAIFNYSLIPLLLLLKYDPVLITAFFTVLNIFTGLVIFFLIRKRFNSQAAILSMFLFLFNDYMIAHSLFIWILNYLPLFGILIFYLLAKKEKYLSLKTIFLLGLLCGVSFALEYAFLFLALPIFIYSIYRSKEKIKTIPLFIFAAAIPNLPLIVFDLKHQFFNLNILWQYALDIFSGKGSTSLSYYHFLSLWPIACVLVALCLLKYIRKLWVLTAFITVYFFYSLTSPLVSFSHAVGMPFGLRFNDISKTSEIIAKEGKEFNLLSFFDFDTEARPLRYLLTYVFHNKPQELEVIDQSKTIYIFTPDFDTYNKSLASEKRSFANIAPELVATISGKYQLYKITK